MSSQYSQTKQTLEYLSYSKYQKYEKNSNSLRPKTLIMSAIQYPHSFNNFNEANENQFYNKHEINLFKYKLPNIWGNINK